MGAYWGVSSWGSNAFVGAFDADGTRLGVFSSSRPEGDLPPAFDTNKQRPGTVQVIEFRAYGDEYVTRPLAQYALNREDGTWYQRTDTNGDGFIDANDKLGEAIKGVPGTLTTRWVEVQPDGTIISVGGGQGSLGIRWKFQGLNADGTPKYAFEQIPLNVSKEARNPYNFEKPLRFSQSKTQPVPGGGMAVCAVLRDSLQGMGFSNSGATDLMRISDDGKLIWLRPMNEVTPVQGVKPLGRYMVSSYGHEAWWLIVDNDGLGLGEFGTPAALNWNLYWIDHPRHTRAFVGADGKTHIPAGDYVNNMVHWLTVTGDDTIRRSRFSLTISEDKAEQIAARKVTAFEPRPTPPPAQVVVKRLDAPMKMDGDLDKWRKAVPAPQVLITPATAMGGIDSPADLSAVVRMAYHGNTLDFQYLVFDDAIAQHQSAVKFYMQDSVQMTINGLLTGYAFNVATLEDGTEFLFRNRFYVKDHDKALDPNHAARKF
jgi:hypothetical protein